MLLLDWLLLDWLLLQAFWCSFYFVPISALALPCLMPNKPAPYERFLCCLWNEKMLPIQRSVSEKAPGVSIFTSEPFFSFEAQFSGENCVLFWSDIIQVHWVDISALCSSSVITPGFREKLENSFYFSSMLLPFKLLPIEFLSRLECESRIFHGHPFHPLNKLRVFPAHKNITNSQVLSYSPELGKRVDVAVVEIDGCEYFGPFHKCLEELGVEGVEKRSLLLVHPLQLSGEETIALCTLPALPLCNWRTLALGQFDVKLSLELWTTSSKRMLSRFAVHNGPLLSKWFEENVHLEEFCCGLTFEFCLEVAGAYAREGFSCLLRRIPATKACELHHYIPIAFFFEPLDTQKGFYLEHFWDECCLEAFVQCFVGGTVGVFVEFGVALEAHGQNIMVLWNSASRKVEGIAYRDFGGIKIEPLLAQELKLLPNSPIVALNECEMLCAFSHGFFSVVICLQKCYSANWPFTKQVLRREIKSALAKVKVRNARALALEKLLAGDQKEIPMKSLLRMACEDAEKVLWCSVGNPLSE